MTEWEYRRIDLNEQRPRSDELDMLNAAGADGWELISITSTNIAYLKRPIEVLAVTSENGRRASASANDGKVDAEREERGREVKAKYRDPTTNDTWSGRGRMANWLKRKQEAGEDIEAYRI